jgi:hypothetical protein
MRTFLLPFAAAFLLHAAVAQPDAKPVGGTGPLIEIDTETIDYGTIPKGSDGYRQFTVTNTGDRPLILSECTGSCGCTVPKCDPTPILPGQRSVVRVHFDTERVGPFTKTVTVNSNAANGAKKTVAVRGVVEAAGTGALSAPARTTVPSVRAK